MTALDHPGWCDPLFCDAPAEQPTEYDPSRGSRHHSNPVELAHFGSMSFSLTLSADASERGVWAWLTQAIAPWHCSTYLRIGLWTVGGLVYRDIRPEALFSLEMDPRHMIDQKAPMSGGERLRHLCTYALSESKNRARRTVDELLAERDRPFTAAADQ